jgi:hypothetical protein
MRREKKTSSLFFLSVFSFISLLAVSSASENGTLWQKAVKVASENENWVPGTVIHIEEVYSRLGVRQELNKTYSSLKSNNSGEVELTFQRVIQNGRDVTEEFVQEFGETLVLEESEYCVEHPFSDSVLYVDYVQKGRRRRINEKNCVLYEFTYKNEKGTWEGSAWIDEQSGVPVVVDGTLVSVPLDEKWYTISKLSISTEYISTAAGAWYPQHATVDSVIEVEGDFLQSYRGRIKETYNFEDYWRIE